MDPEAKNAFVEQCYALADAALARHRGLHQDASLLIFDGQDFLLPQNIVSKSTSSPFQQCQHQIITVDSQPSGPAGEMLFSVSRNLQLAGEQHKLKFSQDIFVGNHRRRSGNPIAGGLYSCNQSMDLDTLTKAFVEHYYTTFDADRAGLAGLYQDASMLTFEGQRLQGAQNIVSKLTSLPFQQCQHQITTVDFQPSGPAGGMLVFVSGNLQISGEQRVLKFSQMFHLMPTPQGSYYVLNDIFRLNCA